MKTAVKNKYRTKNRKAKAPRNTLRRTQATSSSRSLFTRVEDAVRFDTSFERGLPVRFVPYILYFTIVGLFYIGNSHYAERMIRKRNQLEREVEDLRANYTTLKAGYMLDSKQSEVAKRVKHLGLVESDTPPHKIIITEP
ncbi:FtsL-like putative cell division protein [Tunicatimonas pelagia]|uniref:FtsL-like putative cell division protein n=1 Tax=Tunicatimonas pelagia TaxID=931531 RepID=UPI0026668D65|nr:FtsL-like putative cell division protein [Tunicatimonas pelagia]WKN41360.1 FtsL-like putative cell division protein [Tunicatimonas pelagia]